MDTRELAVKLDGREYREEMTRDEEREAEDAGLVVVFGAMEFRGAVRDEFGAWEGATAYFTSAGLLTNDCDNEDCPRFKKLKTTAATIDAKWDTEGYSWVYETAIPHMSFNVLEDGEKYCRVIVFALSDVVAA